jgi:hypothetical protein
MPYIQRDSSGRIVGLFGEQGDPAREWLEPDSAELQAFVKGLMGSGSSEVLVKLAGTDTAIARVLEDLIETLIGKNLIRFTDLPDAAQDRLIERRLLRDSVNTLQLFRDDDPGLI